MDTNILSDLIKNKTGTIIKHISKVGEETVCTSIIVASELRYGAVKNGSMKLMKRVEDILKDIPVLPYGAPADKDYGKIRAALEAKGEPIGLNDLFIAAHARSLGITLVTDNVREFGRVQGLKVENWLRQP